MYGTRDDIARLVSAERPVRVRRHSRTWRGINKGELASRHSFNPTICRFYVLLDNAESPFIFVGWTTKYFVGLTGDGLAVLARNGGKWGERG